jgi:hypothetical protein
MDLNGCTNKLTSALWRPSRSSNRSSTKTWSKNLKNSQITLTGQTDISVRHYTGAFPLIECDKMCSPVKPVIKLKASVHSNRGHFFLDSDQLCSSVEPTQFKEIIGWSPTASSEAEKMHLSVKPMIPRGQHRFNRRYYFLSDNFFYNGSIGLAVYISTPIGFNSSLSTLQTLYTHSWVLRATRSIIHHHSTCQVIKIQVKAKRLSWCIHSWCSILLKWRLGLVTLGDLQHLGGLGDRGPSELAVVIVEARRRSWWPCSWFELHHAGDGKWRLLVSAHCLCDMGVT